MCKYIAATFAALTMFTLAACGTATPAQYQNDLNIIRNSVTLAESAASIYVALPACGSPGASAICSDPDVVAKIRDAATKVNTALDAAQKAVDAYTASTSNDPTSAFADLQQAIADLNSVIPAPTQAAAK